MQSRVLEQGPGHEYLIQIHCDKHDVIALHPREVLAKVNSELSKRIAALLFEKIEPKIMEILREELQEK